MQKRKKKKERKSFGSLTRVFGRGKQRRTLDSGLFEAGRWYVVLIVVVL